MITRIGLVAGDIWSYLDKNGKEARLGDVVSALQIDRDLVLMSIGWLSREGHLILRGKASNYTIKLA